MHTRNTYVDLKMLLKIAGTCCTLFTLILLINKKAKTTLKTMHVNNQVSILHAINEENWKLAKELFLKKKNIVDEVEAYDFIMEIDKKIKGYYLCLIEESEVNEILPRIYSVESLEREMRYYRNLIQLCKSFKDEISTIVEEKLNKQKEMMNQYLFKDLSEIVIEYCRFFPKSNSKTIVITSPPSIEGEQKAGYRINTKSDL